MSLTPEVRKRIVSNIKKRVAASHFNAAGIHYDTWFKRVNERLVDVVSPASGDFEADVRTLLQELGTSHTAFYHNIPTKFPPQHTINATLTSVSDGGGETWMFLDVFPEGPAATAGVKPGDLLLRVDRVEQVPPTMPSFAVGS